MSKLDSTQNWISKFEPSFISNVRKNSWKLSFLSFFEFGSFFWAQFDIKISIKTWKNSKMGIFYEHFDLSYKNTKMAVFDDNFDYNWQKLD